MSKILLIHGDCLEIIPRLRAKIDAVVTDPPYGIRHSSSYGASWANTEIKGDTDTSARDKIVSMFPEIPLAIFGTWKTQPVDRVRAVLVWDKGPAFGMGDLSIPWKPSWELIYICGSGWTGKRDEGVLRGHLVVSWESKGRCHPHQKPVSLIETLLKKIPHAKTILDPFMGSGSTGVACLNLGRNFIGIEQNRAYFRIAQRRLRAARSKQRTAA